ncbi:MAPEG family protein [Sphingomonas humi]|uniref:MAPEG family protein n=1 Tax=Sphingomonas humi TaxID=335630 RepID=UPI0031E09677
MQPSPLLGPIVALVAWSLVMLVWMAIARRGAFKRLGVSLRTIPPGSRGAALDASPEAKAQWKAHNYNHLMEQPTLFYAIVLALAVMGFDHPVNVMLAWAYVALRVIHSIVQATINVVAIRLSLFALSTFCLAALTFHAAMALWH